MPDGSVFLKTPSHLLLLELLSLHASLQNYQRKTWAHSFSRPSLFSVRTLGNRHAASVVRWQEVCRFNHLSQEMTQPAPSAPGALGVPPPAPLLDPAPCAVPGGGSRTSSSQGRVERWGVMWVYPPDRPLFTGAFLMTLGRWAVEATQRDIRKSYTAYNDRNPEP